MHGGPRRKDSHTGHTLPFLWHEGSPRVIVYFPQSTKTSHGHQYLKKVSLGVGGGGGGNEDQDAVASGVK